MTEKLLCLPLTYMNRTQISPIDFPLVTTALTLLLFHSCSAPAVATEDARAAASGPPAAAALVPAATPVRHALMLTWNEECE